MTTTKKETHCRVIPRDFFNEAKLLKCLGVVSLKILDCKLPEGVNIEIKEEGEAFDVQLTSDGILFVSNYHVFVNDKPVMFGTTYNSKNNFPLLCILDYCEYPVLDESGEFDEDFIQMAKELI
jgi:hypothetical protein